MFITLVLYCRDAILKSVEKKLNSSDLNDYDLLVAASIYFNEQVSTSYSTNSYLCSFGLEFDSLDSDLYSCCLNHIVHHDIVNKVMQFQPSNLLTLSACSIIRA